MTVARVFFLNRFGWPDERATAQLLDDLARALAAGGLAVTIVTSHSADLPSPQREIRDGVEIQRVRTTRLGRRHLVGRLLDFATFYPGALWRLSRLARHGDTVVALTDPPLIGVVAALITWLRGARLVHWVQDIYPEIAAELLGQRWPLLLRPIRNLAWHRATACVVPGRDMAVALATAGVPAERVVVSANWAPAGVSPAAPAAVQELRTAWGLAGRFIAAYSGNLGRAHDLSPLLDVAAALRDEPAFALLFIGEGARRAALESAARARHLANVHFRPPQPRAQLAVTLGLGDIHFVTLQPGAEQWVFPSKLYGIAAVGRPVLFLGSPTCELAQLVVRHGLGSVFTRDDVVGITRWLAQLRTADPAVHRNFAAAAQAFAAAGFRQSVDQWQNLIRRTLAAR